MRLSRFFIDAPLSLGEHELPEAQAHYIGRVLRMAEGDALQVFDGSGQEFLGRLLEVGKKRVRVLLDETFAGQVESPLAIHLGQGLSRGERMDWAIQKGHRAGCDEITPIMSERCEVRLKDERADKRLAHWRQVAISACEQCGRSRVPVIHPPVLLTDWIKTTEADLKLVLHPVSEPAGQPRQACTPGVPDRPGRRLDRQRSRSGPGGGLPAGAPRPTGTAYRNRPGGRAGRGSAVVG
jgi:16S rRNA (uracil1498-N3)-methyltransferase